MMYVHVIDECIERAETELTMYRSKNLTEYAKHVERRIESLKRIREQAPTAVIGFGAMPNRGRKEQDV